MPEQTKTDLDAPHVVIDRRDQKLYLDGVEFPYLIDERGPEVENIADANSFPIVLIPVIASDVRVIPVQEGQPAARREASE
ncbi:hypothetical protein [Gordonia sp. UCD-TK1]|uniref:hypothetical protein n=1 Tax=Gordonia sp. UCD-TK1 TaxID=1857893 RepID=UPI00080E36C6|nr:hypothetical protein [Gordonia sp. UCD-TK1]OCH81000.1 hypothetical protein A9310_19765 [Gordonia sp. UCD-TK1]